MQGWPGFVEVQVYELPYVGFATPCTPFKKTIASKSIVSFLLCFNIIDFIILET